MAAKAQTTEAAHYAMSQKNAAQAYYGALLDHPNVRAGLQAIQAAEGTAKAKDPYSVGFGFSKIGSLDKHPGKSVGFTQTNGKKNRTTAAGAYQFLSGTWKSVASKLGLKDFGPVSQDIGALSLIDQAGALGNLVAGDIAGLTAKVNGIWASLPGAPYAQPTRSMNFVQTAFDKSLYSIQHPDPITPTRAPTPFGPNTPTAIAQARPENYSYGGPKGKFSVGPPSLAPAPVGKVERMALAPAAPRTPGMITMPSRPTSMTPSTALAAANKPAFSRPARPTTPTPATALAAINKPAFTPSVPTSAITGLMAAVPTAAPQTFTPQPTTLMPPSVVAPPAVAPPAPVARVSAPVSRPSMPAAPRATAMDVYGGAAMQAMDNSGKNMVSRDALGNMSVTNQYGVTTTTSPQGFSSVSYGPKAPSAPAPSAISGPLGTPGVTQSKGFLGIQPAKTETGNIARGVVGSAVGSAIGSTLGPIGSLIGAALGNSIAKGKNPFDALTGKQGMLSFNTPAFGIINAPSPVGGLGFPNAPTAKGALGGTQSNRSMDGMKGISPGAAAAIGKGLGGLY